ncbi:UDP-glucuronosyl and UDP-glucosyl transferase [Handroanthus impetiginosus]|uniref:Glycosyltransferase n=1 Tax=Handroanthus impetiginosus TaxID=429701 RepID=A0A2G9GYB6_9LAMI|nr:UDP-glucuronosyl and UDP-glucosyl transferase [Handroanthus impetiginosus]
MASGKENLKVLMFPWLAYGHISPFLELAKRLSERNFPCYICSTPYFLSIQLVELNLPCLPKLPPHCHTTNGLPLNLHSTLRRDLRMAKPEFLNMMKDLQPHLLIHDVLQLWAGSEATLNKIPAVPLFTSGATMVSYFCHLGMRPGIEFPFHLSVSPNPDDETSCKIGSIILMNSSREIEGKYMDYLSKLINMKIVPVGAFVQYPNIEGESTDGDSDIMDWLAKKDKFSSVLVSFGSEYFLKKEEIEEIANGLEHSNVNFILLIRFPKGEEMKVEEALPQGFLERVGERGRIVEKWAPQAKILGHSSIGGFVSHCGWNSLMESIEFGVPIIAMPMHLDQPMDARLVVELGVGVEVKRDDEGRLQRDGLSKVVNDVLFGKTGESLRRKVGELRENVRLRSREELEDVILMLEQLGGRERENYTNKVHK